MCVCVQIVAGLSRVDSTYSMSPATDSIFTDGTESNFERDGDHVIIGMHKSA